jgi:hypothetical protein
MEAVLDIDEVYIIWNVLNQEVFFANLHKLLPEEDYILGLASFMPDRQVALWLKSLPQLPITGRFNYRHLTKVNSENADGGAYYLPATRQNLNELTRLTAAVKGPECLCSHVIAFRKDEALFSFHDAFEGSALLVSSKIPESQVAAFSRALGLEWKLIANPQQPSGWRWHSK